jgi:hypothetical protein
MKAVRLGEWIVSMLSRLRGGRRRSRVSSAWLNRAKVEAVIGPDVWVRMAGHAPEGRRPHAAGDADRNDRPASSRRRAMRVLQVDRRLPLKGDDGENLLSGTQR